MVTSAINTREINVFWQLPATYDSLRRRRMAVSPLKDFSDQVVLRPAWVEEQGPRAVSKSASLWRPGTGLEGILGGQLLPHHRRLRSGTSQENRG